MCTLYMSLKHTVNEKAFSLWSSEIAYVIGYVYADGHLQNVPNIRGQYLRITSTDRDRLEFIRATLSSTHNIIQLPKKEAHHKDKFLLSIGSKALYKDLIHKGLHPAKSLDMVMPIVPKKYFSHFVRGYFDGDGCVFIEKRASKDGMRLNINRLTVVFTSGSKKFLEQLGAELMSINCINTTKIYANGTSFQMRLSTREALQLSSFMYVDMPTTSYMERKKQIFEEYRRIRKLLN